MTRRIYQESKIPMTEQEHSLFLKASSEHHKKCLEKGRSHADSQRLGRSAGERAVRRSRGRVLSAQERTLDLFAVAG